MSQPLYSFNWMSAVDGSKSLYDLSIPGTHDTCALYGGDLVKTQKNILSVQLMQGIRFIDIRCRHIDNVFTIHHGEVYQKINFGDGVLKVCLEFLEANPTETIIMSIKEEYKPKKNTRSFEQTFEWYLRQFNCRDKWYLGDTVPKLKDVRGKIVLFRRFSTDNPGEVLGLKALPWPDDATFNIDNTARMRVQDEYKVATLFNRKQKWEKVEKLLDEAGSSGKQVLYVNFSSGSSSGCYPNAVASYVNPRITEYFLSHKQGRYGILAMDFESTDRNLLIAHTNIPYTAGYWILSNKGNITCYGDAENYSYGKGKDNDAVAMASMPQGDGYWILCKNGGVHAFGNARHFGQGKGKDNDAVAIAATPKGDGYWILCKNGNIHSFGNAGFHGEGKGKDNDAVAIAATPKGEGYWILCKNGNIHSFGNAGFHGQGKGRDNDAVAMASMPQGDGYWILCKNGAIHAFGNAGFHGEGKGKDNDAVAITGTEDGKGYWIVCKNGGIHAFGNAVYAGAGCDGNAVAICRS